MTITASASPSSPPPHMRSFKRLMIAVALYITAALTGVGLAWWSVKFAVGGDHTVRVGAWTGSTLSGSTDADILTRARVAVTGLLALGREETMYFVAMQDDSGQKLKAQCRYRVSGLPPQARWWSVTAYADDLFLFNAPNGRYSLNGTTAQLDAQGRFNLVTGPQAPSGLADGVAWLPTPGKGGLVFTLRLYNPLPPLQAAPGSLVAPTITREGDCV